MKKKILYPTTVINYVIDDIARLSNVRNANEVTAHYGSQITNYPHLGTIISAMCAYAIAKHISEQKDLQPKVNFTFLENEGGIIKIVNGIKYQKMLCDEEGNVFQKYLNSFKDMFFQMSSLSGVPLTIDSYYDLQAKPLARKTLLNIIENQDKIIPIITPLRDKVGIRFKCPECNYLDKHYKTLEMIEYVQGDMAKFRNNCFDHGKHEHIITPNNNDFFDVSGMVRNIMKEVVLESQSNKSYPIIVKGSDWIPTAIMVSEALEELGYSRSKRPQRLFTPLVLDWSGAKLSKSENQYQKSPLLSYPEFIKTYGIDGLKILWDEVSSWAKDTKKFYRHYTINFFTKLLGDSQ